VLSDCEHKPTRRRKNAPFNHAKRPERFRLNILRYICMLINIYKRVEYNCTLEDTKKICPSPIHPLFTRYVR
jgi:hypothetical protein